MKGLVMDFNELLEMLRNPGEDGPPETIYDDLSASYTDATSTRDAKIQTSTDELAALQAELLASKAANWDLLQQIPQVDNSEEPNDNETESDPHDIGDDDDFFEDKEKN